MIMVLATVPKYWELKPNSKHEIQAKCRSDEELINYRPSPNYKHKKYLRSKFEEAMMIEANSSCVEPNVSLLGHNKLDKVNTFVATTTVQPPLPPNPPPPDTPPMITHLKQEIEDDEYKCDTSSEFNQSQELKPSLATIKTDQSDEPVQPTITMCRNFARGTCKKGAACIFAHELILAQLPGVYTFCRNFQNSVCSFPKCKFVHATVFEKEHFYRTGYLPPHSLAHLKEATVQQSPSLPPQSEEASAEQPAVYCNAPPPPQISCVPPVAVRYNAEAAIEPDMFRLQPDTSTTPQKRDWNQIGEVSSPTVDRDSGVPLTKKCINCGTKDLSERLLDAQIEQARRRKLEISQNIAELNKKNQLMESLLAQVLKLNHPSTTSKLSAEFQTSTDRDINNLSPNNNLRSMLAKMLMSIDSGSGDIGRSG